MFQALISDYVEPTLLPMATVVTRLLLALVLGGMIGWNREASSRPAGLRTHMLISIGAAMFTITAMELTSFKAADDAQVSTDPLRLIGAVTSGVAFLAAGSIVINGGNVRGVTTGASMWMVGAIGLCCGTGDVKLAILGTGMVLIVLWLIGTTLKPAVEAMHDDKGDETDGNSDEAKD